MALYLFILIPIAAGILFYLVHGKKGLWIALTFQAVLFVLSIVNFIYIYKHGWVEFAIGGFSKKASITLWCDNLAGAMIMLTAFVLLVCFAFGLADRFMNNRFVFFFFVLEALIITIFLSKDLFNLYVVTEVSTIVVAVLIMFKKDTRSMYDGMLYLVTNVAGMSFFLFGTAFIYRTFGSLDMDLIEAQMHVFENPNAMILPFAFMMTGISLKCAFFPLFSWLPKAHATPSAPVIISVVLSGLYVNCGIFMYMRVREMFLPAIVADSIFLTIGIVTGIIGFILALFQYDIKKMLAYSTVSQVGLILIGLSSGGEDAYYGGFLHMMNHAVFKSLLFLTAGIIISEYGTRNINKIRGVFKKMPYVSIMTIAAILGITGAPLFNGSISKYFIEHDYVGSVVEYAVILINFGTIIYFIKLIQIFFGAASGEKTKTGIWKKASMTVMAALCLLLGLAGVFVIESVFNFPVHVDFHEYLKNTGIFFLSLGASIFLYIKYLKKVKIIKEGMTKEIGVNEIAVSITAFFIFVFATTSLIL